MDDCGDEGFDAEDDASDEDKPPPRPPDPDATDERDEEYECEEFDFGECFIPYLWLSSSFIRPLFGFFLLSKYFSSFFKVYIQKLVFFLVFYFR